MVIFTTSKTPQHVVISLVVIFTTYAFLSESPIEALAGPVYMSPGCNCHPICFASRQRYAPDLALGTVPLPTSSPNIPVILITRGPPVDRTVYLELKVIYVSEYIPDSPSKRSLLNSPNLAQPRVT